jgi:hypothetical protein
VSIEVGKVRKPSPTMYFLLFGCLRAKYYSLQANSQKHTTDWALSAHIEEHWREEYLEGLLSREREYLPCVVWGSGREFHGCLMVR